MEVAWGGVRLPIRSADRRSWAVSWQVLAAKCVSRNAMPSPGWVLNTRKSKQLTAATCGSELRKLSGESHSGRYPTSGSRSFVAKYFLVGVRIRNEYPHVAALRLLLLRALKTRPGVGIAFRGTPATPSTPPDPAHNRQSALRIGSHTPPQAPSTTPPSHGVVALGP